MLRAECMECNMNFPLAAMKCIIHLKMERSLKKDGEMAQSAVGYFTQTLKHDLLYCSHVENDLLSFSIAELY